MVDIVMYMTVLRDGTVKTRVEVVNWGAIDNTVIHEETISRERACNIVQNQFYVASALTRVCNDLLEKAIGELSDIENSIVEGDIILDYQRLYLSDSLRLKFYTINNHIEPHVTTVSQMYWIINI